MSNKSNRKVALITGGTRGIGLGIARELAADGFNLALNGVRNEATVADVIRDLESDDVEVLYAQGDISVAESRQNIIKAVSRRFGRLDVLVNNVGIAPKVRADLLEATEESFEHVMRTNLQGPYFLTQACANWMIAQKKSSPEFAGCIVNVSSISATMASVNRGEYCISKAAISMATQLWAARLGEHNIPVYEVRPGIIKTDMTAGVQAKYDKLLAEGLAIQHRWGTPADVGKAVAALARGDFPYSTGQIVMVDGGLSVPRL